MRPERREAKLSAQRAELQATLAAVNAAPTGLRHWDVCVQIADILGVSAACVKERLRVFGMLDQVKPRPRAMVPCLQFRTPTLDRLVYDTPAQGLCVKCACDKRK